MEERSNREDDRRRKAEHRPFSGTMQALISKVKEYLSLPGVVASRSDEVVSGMTREAGKPQLETDRSPFLSNPFNTSSEHTFLQEPLASSSIPAHSCLTTRVTLLWQLLHPRWEDQRLT